MGTIAIRRSCSIGTATSESVDSSVEKTHYRVHPLPFPVQTTDDEKSYSVLNFVASSVGTEHRLAQSDRTALLPATPMLQRDQHSVGIVIDSVSLSI